MGPVRLLARPMLAAAFVSGGAEQLMHPERGAELAGEVADVVGDALPQVRQASDTQLVQLNGAAQVAGGLLLALGKMPRLAALLLAGSLVPTTLAGHRFWEAGDLAERAEDKRHFLKNLSMLGGLLIATMDLEGRPGIAWRASHKVDHAKIAAEHATEIAHLRKELAKKALAPDLSEHLRVRKELAKKRLTPDIMDLKSLVDTVRS